MSTKTISYCANKYHENATALGKIGQEKTQSNIWADIDQRSNFLSLVGTKTKYWEDATEAILEKIEKEHKNSFTLRKWILGKCNWSNLGEKNAKHEEV